MKRRYAVTQNTLRGEHGAFNRRIVSLHRTKREAQGEASGPFLMVQLQDEAKVGDRVSMDGKRDPDPRPGDPDWFPALQP